MVLTMLLRPKNGALPVKVLGIYGKLEKHLKIEDICQGVTLEIMSG